MELFFDAKLRCKSDRLKVNRQPPRLTNEAPACVFHQGPLPKAAAIMSVCSSASPHLVFFPHHCRPKEVQLLPAGSPKYGDSCMQVVRKKCCLTSGNALVALVVRCDPFPEVAPERSIGRNELSRTASRVTLCVPFNRKSARIDIRCSSDYEVRQQSPRAASHSPTQSTVSGVEEEIAKFCRADDRRAVRRHRSKAGPERCPRQVSSWKQIAHDHFERLPALGIYTNPAS